MPPTDQTPGTRPPRALPRSFRVVADADTRAATSPGGGLTLVGGSPWRVLRLRPPAPRLWEALADGATLAAAAAAAGLAEGAAAALVRRLLDAGFVHPRPGPGPGPASEAAPDVRLHVVIPVHDRRDGLARLLDSLQAAGTPMADVTVVDDGSGDGSGSLAADRGARVVRHERPVGPGGARHAGVEDLPDGAVVAFLDSDTVVEQGWAGPLVAHLADPAVAAIAPRIGPLDPARHGAVARYEAARSPLDLGARPGPVQPRTRIAYVPAAALVVRVDAYRSVGGFDPAMPVGEDVDFVWRLAAAGWTVRYEPAVVVGHDHRDALGAFLRRRYQYATSAAALDERHPGLVPPVAVNAWSAVGWTAALVAPPWGAATGLVVGAATAARLAERLGPDGVPRSVALGLAARGHLGAGRLLAQAAWRTHLPLVAAAAVLPSPLRRPARRALLLAAVVPNLVEWRSRRPRLDPVRWIALRLADDAASSAGLWAAAVPARRWGALRPDLSAGVVRRRTS